MSEALESYLDRVMVYANRPEHEVADLRNELEDHLLKKIDDLEGQGLSSVDAIHRAVDAHGHPRVIGYGLRRGFPLVDIRSSGTARGVIAIGPRAVGIVACGGMAVGVIACGGLAVGVLATGGVAAALVFAFCGVGVATVANGGIVLGVLAMGVVAVGVVAYGAWAIGLLAHGPMVWSFYDAQSAPVVMTRILSATNTMWLWICLAWAPFPLLLVMVLVMTVLSARERHRLQDADTWLQE